MTREMSLMIGGAADFLKAFREVWEMPYVVVPPDSEREQAIREKAIYGGHAALWRSKIGPTSRR